MRIRHLISNPRLPLALLSLTLSGMLWAAPGDTVQAYATSSVSYDDNLLRLSKDVDPVAVAGQPSAADTIKQGAAGVKVDWKQGRQEVLLDGSINRTVFARFTTLDYQATNIQSRWNWQFGNTLSGDLGYDKTTSMGSFSEVQQLTSTLNTHRDQFFDGAWQAMPDMRLKGSVSHSDYNVPSDAVYGNDYMSYSVGAFYTPRSGNEIGIRGTRQIQRYPVLQVISGTPVDNGFTQNQLLATIDWLYNGHIRLNGQAGIVNRNHNQFQERNFNGKTMRGTLTWLASGKSQVNLTAWNEIDPYDNLTTSYTQSKGISVGPTWMPTAKLAVTALVQKLNRDFLGNPYYLIFPVPVREDTVRTASLSINYQPLPALNISASMQIERRTSNQLYVDYADKTVSVSVSFLF